MKQITALILVLPLLMLVACRKSAESQLQIHPARGVVQELKPDGKTVVIKHQAIPGYMDAMTMPFRVKQLSELAGLQPGDEVSFRLLVDANESWIDQVIKTGNTQPIAAKPVSAPPATNAVGSFKLTDIPNFALTNELGEAVSLRQYQGKAVALTFMFTRCPVPEYCPRLTRNFEEAARKLKAMTNAPRNWHLLMLSFDPLDTPAVLKAYGQRYHYDPQHWSFVTGDPNHIKELTRGFGLSVTNDGYFYTHDFRTIIFDASGRLQVMWPVGGDTSDIIVQELLKGTAVNK